MIKVSQESEGNVLVFEAEKKLTDQDYKDVLIPRVESVIRDQGKARVLLDVANNFRGWEPKALWDDASFGLAHRKDFDKIAIVTDRRWVKWAVKLGACMVPGKVKVFPPGQRGEARRWIKA